MRSKQKSRCSASVFAEVISFVSGLRAETIGENFIPLYRDRYIAPTEKIRRFPFVFIKAIWYALLCRNHRNRVILIMQYIEKTYKNVLQENKTIKDCQFSDCVFEQCRFTDCVFINCLFSNCRFTECSIVNLQANGTGMAFTTFVKCELVGIRWDKLETGIISFPIEKLENCFLKYNVFEKMNFKKFNFLRSAITESSFSECDLSDSNFYDCNLKGTTFADCDLRKSNFGKATGYNIDIKTNKIRGAKFSYPDVLNLLRGFGITIEK